MRTPLPIHLDRAAKGLADRGVRLRRTAVLQFLSETFGRSNSNELAAAMERGELDLPAATVEGATGALVTLLDPVAGLPFSVHASRLGTGAGGREADHMVSPYGNLLDVSHARGRVAVARARPGARRGERDIPTLASFVNDARARGRSLVTVYRGPRDVGVQYGDDTALADRRYETIWAGVPGQAPILEAECFGTANVARPGRDHPLGIMLMRYGTWARIRLDPGDAEPLVVPPTLEGLLGAAASTGATRFVLDCFRNVETLGVDYPETCELPDHGRLTWQGDLAAALEVVRRASGGDAAIGRHGARAVVTGGETLEVTMPAGLAAVD